MSESTPTGGEAAGDPGRPGRYTRSTNGLIGSMIVLVLVVLGIVVFRGAFRDTPHYEPEHVDYLELVTSVQQAGLHPLYPPRLPDGWYAKGATFKPGDRPELDLVFTTDDAHTVGLHQEDAGALDLVHEYVGGGASRADEVSVPGSAVPTWTQWDDTDGDHAYTAEVGDETVLVYTTGGLAQLRDFVGTLTQASLAP